MGAGGNSSGTRQNDQAIGIRVTGRTIVLGSRPSLRRVPVACKGVLLDMQIVMHIQLYTYIKRKTSQHITKY